MYHSEEITPDIIQKITQGEDRELYKIGTGNRIVIAKRCQHCDAQFYPCRKSQKYCSASCRVMACYQRQGYQYKSGHYKKVIKQNHVEKLDNIDSELIPLKDIKEDSFSLKRTGEAALGSAAVEAAKYFIHDKPMMDKINKILSQVSGNTLNNGIQYVGIQNIGGKAVSVFKDARNMIIINDQSGRWFKLISKNPPKWQVVKSPFL